MTPITPELIRESDDILPIMEEMVVGMTPNPVWHTMMISAIAEINKLRYAMLVNEKDDPVEDGYATIEVTLETQREMDIVVGAGMQFIITCYAYGLTFNDVYELIKEKHGDPNQSNHLT